MSTIRYAARQPAQRRNREVEATTAEIWSEAVSCIYETDPEIIAAILPRPLEPSSEAGPLVRATITTVTMPGGRPFGAGWFGVRARHGDIEGEYPLFMPMTSEQATVGGRETYGEPKKIGEVWVKRDGDQVEGVMARMGFTVCEIRGRITGTRPAYEKDKIDFYFKLGQSPDGVGLDRDPLLVYGKKHERSRVHEGIDGEIILKDSPLDPIADLVVRRVIDLNWTERATHQIGEIQGTVPAEWLLPVVHQRYDDLSVLGAGAKDRS